MAINPAGTLPPELFAEQQALNRQQQMAQLLMHQGQQQPQGQMVSGRFVPTSFFQNLAPLVQTYMGTRMAEQGDKKALDIAARLRAGESQAMADFNKIKQGTPAVEGGIYGADNKLTMQTTPDMFDANMQLNPQFRQVAPVAAVAPNPQAAFEKLYSDPRATQRLRDLAFNKMTADPEAITLSEGQIRSVRNPDGTFREVARGSEKPRTPTSVDMGTMGTMLIYPDGRREIIQKGVQGPAGQVIERDDGTFLVDTRTGQARPIMGQSGQPLTGGGKPLTEAQGNSVAFGARAIEANRIVTELEKAGTTNTGIIRSALGGTVGMAPFVGQKMEQTVQSAMNVFPTFAGGPNEMQQQTDQGRRNFISAVLRKESGAAIPADEYASEEKKYFPQVGDGPKVIQQKQEARKLAIEALKAQAGPSGVRQINQISSQPQGGGGVVDFNSLPAGK